MAQRIVVDLNWDNSFKAPLKPNAPKLRGKANWDAWSKAIKKHLNEQNFYFALHEESQYKFENLTQAGNDLPKNPLVGPWVEQTLDEEMQWASARVQRDKYLEGVYKDNLEWRTADAHAKEIICDNLGPEMLLSNSDREGSAREIWKKLERMHLDANLDDVETAIAAIERLSVDKRLSAKTRAVKMTKIRKDLESWGVDLLDTYLIIITLLRGLELPFQRYGQKKALEYAWDEFENLVL